MDALLTREFTDEDVRAIDKVPGRFRIQSNRYQCERCYQLFLHPEREEVTLDEPSDLDDGGW